MRNNLQRRASFEDRRCLSPIMVIYANLDDSNYLKRQINIIFSFAHSSFYFSAYFLNEGEALESFKEKEVKVRPNSISIRFYDSDRQQFVVFGACKRDCSENDFLCGKLINLKSAFKLYTMNTTTM